MIFLLIVPLASVRLQVTAIRRQSQPVNGSGPAGVSSPRVASGVSHLPKLVPGQTATGDDLDCVRAGLKPKKKAAYATFI
jgi:hypothetical protein